MSMWPSRFPAEGVGVVPCCTVQASFKAARNALAARAGRQNGAAGLTHTSHTNHLGNGTNYSLPAAIGPKDASHALWHCIMSATFVIEPKLER